MSLGNFDVNIIYHIYIFIKKGGEGWIDEARIKEEDIFLVEFWRGQRTFVPQDSSVVRKAM